MFYKINNINLVCISLLTIHLKYCQRLLISACFSHAYASLVYVVHASKKHALISKHLW